jgi:hypothetical protein
VFINSAPQNPPRFIALLIVVGVGAGAIAGLLEFLFAAFKNDHIGSADLLPLALSAIGIIGLVGLLYVAAMLVVVRVSLFAATRSKALVLLCALLAGAGSFYLYEGVQRFVIATLVALAYLAILKSRAIALTTGCFLAWVATMLSLAPLFAGHSMQLVFTPSETLLILSIVALLLFLALHGMLRAPFSLLDLSPAPGVLALIIASIAAIALTFLSSVFLIRLWGFNTMNYLQLAFIGLELLLLALVLTVLTRHWHPRRGITAFALLLLGMTTLAAVTGAHQLSTRPHARKALYSAFPQTSYWVRTVANAVDQDRDRFSGILGFNDCDDQNRLINPILPDKPNDGVDQNCVGGDLSNPAHLFFQAPIVARRQTTADSTRRRVAVLFVVDTLRNDTADLQGKKTLTPNLQAIAAQSTVWPTTYAQANHTMESFPFLLQLGFRRLPFFNSDWTLAKLLRSGGIRTVGIFESSAKSWWLEGLEDEYFQFDKIIRPDLATRLRPLPDLVDSVVEELKAPATQDLFIFVHLERLHDAATHVMQGTRMIDRGINIGDLFSLWRIQALVALMRERYETVMRQIDTILPPLWAALREVEKDAEVSLIFTADHGEEFFEHGGLFHMGSLYEETVRVPLLAYRSGVPASVRHETAALYQVPPTLLDFFGYTGSPVEEFSLWRTPTQSRPIFAAFSSNLQYHRRVTMLVEDNFKLIYNNEQGLVELYDLSTDPGELSDLAENPRYSEQLSTLLRRLDSTLFYLSYGDH